jgi:hypothetical protein
MIAAVKKVQDNQHTLGYFSSSKLCGLALNNCERASNSVLGLETFLNNPEENQPYLIVGFISKSIREDLC